MWRLLERTWRAGLGVRGSSTSRLAEAVPTWGFFLGPDKAGSSWLHALLSRMPEVAVPRAKELFYFDRHYERGEDWYLSRFALGEQVEAAVEVCHDYLPSPEAARRIGADLPASRLMIMARHPLDRAVSAYLYMVRQGRLRQDFRTAVHEVDELLDHARYGKHVAAYREYFAREQILVADFDRFRRDQQWFVDQVCQHLGVSRRLLGPADGRPVRPASRARVQPLATAGKRTAEVMRTLGLDEWVGRLKSSAWLEAALFRPLEAESRPAVDPETRAWVRRQLIEDTRQLDAQVGGDFAQRWWG